MTADVARITDLPEDEDVDLDLGAEDELLREAIGKPTRIRLTSGDVIEVPHPTEWPYTANAAAGSADFGTWAEQVLSEGDLEAFQAAKMRNYQIQAMFDKVNRQAGVTPGKSRR
jgi:hypothetical protein